MIKYINKGYNDSIWKIKKWFNCGNERMLSKELHKTNKLIITMIKNVKQNLNEINDDGYNNNNLLSLYLKLNDNLNNKQLKDISMNMMFIGNDKTRLLISWFLYEISRNYQIKQKLISCLDECKENDININYNDILNGFSYLD